MNASSPPAANGAGFFSRALLFFEREIGLSLPFWAVVALLNFAVQIIFRRALAPDEFGTLNTVLGVVGLIATPVLALNLAFAFYPTQPHAAERREPVDALRAAAPRVTQACAVLWGGIALLLLLGLLPLLAPSRFSLQFFASLLVLISLGGLASGSICEREKRVRLWGWLLAAAALVKVILGATLARWEPWAEAGLAAFVLAGVIALTPLLSQPEMKWATMKEWRAILDGDFLRHLGATFSVVAGLFLFSSADRLTAQIWFGSPSDNNMGYVNWSVFDGYQTAGLLGRALFWGTQPLLLVLFAQRSRLDRTTAVSLKFFWIYLVALVAGAVLLGLLGQPLSRLFCGADSPATYSLIPAFAVAMTVLGVLQGVGVFALASRRYPECFVLGGCGIGYAFLLYFAGRQPALMLTYMFGGGLVSLLIVLFVGVVRWGRKQP